MSMGGDRGRNPVIYNITCSTASTAYSQVVTGMAKTVRVQPRVVSNIIWMAWASGVVVSSTKFTVGGNREPFVQNDIDLKNKTLYVASPVTGAVVEVMAWK